MSASERGAEEQREERGSALPILGLEGKIRDVSLAFLLLCGCTRCHFPARPDIKLETRNSMRSLLLLLAALQVAAVSLPSWATQFYWRVAPASLGSDLYVCRRRKQIRMHPPHRSTCRRRQPTLAAAAAGASWHARAQ